MSCMCRSRRDSTFPTSLGDGSQGMPGEVESRGYESFMLHEQHVSIVGSCLIESKFKGLDHVSEIPWMHPIIAVHGVHHNVVS